MQFAQSSHVTVPVTADTTPHFYVQGVGDNHIGPVSAELIARGVLSGHVHQGTFVAPVGSSSWMPLEAVPALAIAIEEAKAVEEAKRAASFPPGAPISTLSPVASPFAVVEPPKERGKDEPKKPALDPRYKVLPLVVFGGFAVLAGLETLLTLILR